MSWMSPSPKSLAAATERNKARASKSPRSFTIAASRLDAGGTHRHDPEFELARLPDVAHHRADRIRLVIVVPFVELDRERPVRHGDNRRRAAILGLACSELRIEGTEAFANFVALADAHLQFRVGHRPIPILAVGFEAAELDVETRRATPLARHVSRLDLHAHLARGHALHVLLIGSGPEIDAGGADRRADDEPA